MLDYAFCANKKENVKCEGHRCPLGKCISEDHVCDRKRDCHDGSDETDEICKSRGKCASNEIKCASGNQCIPKIRFCDKFVDCKDSRWLFSTFTKQTQLKFTRTVDVQIRFQFIKSATIWHSFEFSLQWWTRQMHVQNIFGVSYTNLLVKRRIGIHWVGFLWMSNVSRN